MKKLLVGLLMLGCVSSFAGDCSYYLVTDYAENRTAKALNDKGYFQVASEDLAKYRVAVVRTSDGYDFISKIQITDNDLESGDEGFLLFDRETRSPIISSPISPLLKKLRKTFPNCN